MTIKNYTPHALNVRSIEGEVITIEPIGLARVTCSETQVGTLNGFAVKKSTYGEVQGLPEPEDGVVYVVSRMVASALPSRKDLMIPGTLIRDDKGVVVGCDGFSIL